MNHGMLMLEVPEVPMCRSNSGSTEVKKHEVVFHEGALAEGLYASQLHETEITEITERSRV